MAHEPMDMARAAALSGDEETAAEWLWRLPGMDGAAMRRHLSAWREERSRLLLDALFKRLELAMVELNEVSARVLEFQQELPRLSRS